VSEAEKARVKINFFRDRSLNFFDWMLIKHLAAKLEGCVEKKLVDDRLIDEMLENVVRVLDMRLITKVVYKLEKGVSALFLIAESHVAIHTWGDLKLADVEIVTCKASSDVRKGLDVIISSLSPKSVTTNYWEYTTEE